MKIKDISVDEEDNVFFTLEPTPTEEVYLINYAVADMLDKSIITLDLTKTEQEVHLLETLQ